MIKIGSSTVQTAYSWMSLLCLNFFMIWASAKKSFGSMVPNQSITQSQIKTAPFKPESWSKYLPDFNVLMATGVVLFHNPSHTSPNCPDPSFLLNRRELLSISHWSRVRCDSPPVTGFSIYGAEQERQKRFKHGETWYGKKQRTHI